MLDSVWNLFQQGQISSNQAKTESATSLAASATSGVASLQGQIDTLVLANQAMWEILSKQLGVSEEDLVKKMNEIDLRDGKMDGKVSTQRETATNCTECGHKIGRRRPNCYWCGAKLEGGSPFAR
ncbi:Uncharacterised protein [BD1-7 clade bacterium]|uniref:Uncharacterized protein n=1 Tax=BD1-7 clade bacterium TaxID=2029982 RepID=A0A5S9QGT4_9GAMM|nr:Uncharacterised protein [BD1-7 clade bacterium]